MRLISIGLSTVVVLVGTVMPGISAVEVGSSRQEVIESLGPPEFEFTRGGKEVLTYFGLELELVDGTVSKVPYGLSQELVKRQAARKAEQARQASLTRRAPAPRRVAKPVSRPRSGSHGRSVQVIANGGKQVDLNRYVGRGKVTIIDFYADWCGPCRKVAPFLEKLAGSDSQVNLVKIDIVNWKTPVVKQHRVSSVPNMRVYDRNGKVVGKPTSDFRKVVQYVQKAK